MMRRSLRSASWRQSSSAVANVINNAEREAKELRDKIKLQPPDKTDLVGAQ